MAQLRMTVEWRKYRHFHWFDGPAMLHAFSFHDGTIKYTNKFLRSSTYHTIFEEEYLIMLDLLQIPAVRYSNAFLHFISS